MAATVREIKHHHDAVQPKADSPFLAQNKPENEAHLHVRFPPSFRRSEGGDGRLKAAAAEMMALVPKR